LELHQRNVREGVLVEEACDFARYLTNSGICDLMRDNPHKGENPHHTSALQDLFPYDGQSLYDQARALEVACCEYLARPDERCSGHGYRREQERFGGD
jgi:hypothetical protein